MNIKIEKGMNERTDILESNSFVDLSNNIWRIDIAKFRTYIIYLGDVKDRVEKFKIISPEGFELLAGHKNIFSMKTDMNNYYEIRTVIKESPTLGVWSKLQGDILIGQFV